MGAERESTILIIDDDPNNMDIVTDYLSGSNYTILVAEDGESGISRAEYALPGLILLDVMMPGIDGFEVCRRIKEDPQTNSIPVVMLTAKKSSMDQARGMQVGADAYITKPFKSVKIIEIIEGLLKHK